MILTVDAIINYIPYENNRFCHGRLSFIVSNQFSHFPLSCKNTSIEVFEIKASKIFCNIKKIIMLIERWSFVCDICDISHTDQHRLIILYRTWSFL